MKGAVHIVGKRRRARIGIINDVEAPEARMLALAIGMPGVAEVEYISPYHRPLQGKGYALSGWTDVATFGVEVSLTSDGELRVEQVRESTAVYPDGLRRRWQGQELEMIRIRPTLAPIIASFVPQIPTPTAPQPGAER